MDGAVVQNIKIEDDRTGIEVETLKRAFADNLFYVQGKFGAIATRNDLYLALAYTVRDRLLHRWLNTLQAYFQKDVKVVAYLSAEFLLGPHLGNNLINLGLYDRVKQAVEQSGFDLEHLLEIETEPGLGNGGLGRLAACFLDSLATLDISAIGYGIRYEFGIFNQEIRDGWQKESTDKWLHFGNPWEIARPEASEEVCFGGHTSHFVDSLGRYRVQWHPNRIVHGVPYDTPIPGFDTNTAITLRLWSAEACHSFDFKSFDSGDYLGAVYEKVQSETISKVLYPNDNSAQGRRLRLEQQFFFVSCSLQDMLRLHLREGQKVENFHEKFTIQLNDTHPSISVAELMRLLIDVHDLGWDTAWNVVSKTFAYTNHTLLPEALERWPVSLMAELLPRHMEIIYEINQRFIEELNRKFPGDDARYSRMSIIDEDGERFVRMAHLAAIGSHSINGVAALHTELLKTQVMHDFFELWPEKFNNKTNGVTPRRWIALSNPELRDLVSSKIGKTWVKHLDELRMLEPLAKDAEFRKSWQEVKRNNKVQLTKYIREHNGLEVRPDSLFDVQIKRFHEYKRQHLNALHIISLYNKIKDNPKLDVVPRTFVFAGKAAPGYYMAKLIIKLINSIAEVVNADPEIGDKLKVVFLADFNVKLGQRIYPAADLSEQISTAGKEASGTGNMKFAMNGALTIGTLDGANVEIRECVGAENFFLFGLTADQVQSTKQKGYDPRIFLSESKSLKRVIDQLNSGYFSGGDRNLFKPLVDSLIYSDPYMVLADFESYLQCQEKVELAYRNQDKWAEMAILNVARMGYFSSDRTISEYCSDVWKVSPIKITITDYNQDSAIIKV